MFPQCFTILGTIPPDFTNEHVTYVDGFKQNSPVIPTLLCHYFPNLTSFLYDFGNVTQITPQTFEGCRNLRKLILPHNQISDISDGAFINLSSLTLLNLNVNSIQTLRRGMFTGLGGSLTGIYLVGNSISSLPVDIFDGMTALTIIDLGNNRITTIDASSFGSNVNILFWIYLNNNPVHAIDPNFFDSATALNQLDMRGASCANRTFANVQVNRDSFRAELQPCFDNFENDDDAFVRCDYSFSPNFMCWLQMQNPAGRDDFTTVEGELHDDTTHANVTEVFANAQNSRNFPRVICDTFPNTFWMAVLFSQIEVVEATAFGSCSQLLSVFLDHNRITRIPSGIFSNSRQLYFINFQYNEISDIDALAFAGLEGSLESVLLNYNEIVSLPFGLFDGMQVLTNVVVEDNRLSVIDSRSFGSSLVSLDSFWAVNNQISAIDANWFDAASSLMSLGLSGSSCVSTNFFNIGANRDQVRAELLPCFDNFEDSPSVIQEHVRCWYIFDGAHSHCLFDISNPRGRDDFEIIEDAWLTLPSDMTHGDIRTLGSDHMVTPIVPSIVCQQFPNLEDISLLNYRIEVLTPSAFGNCRLLERLHLPQNRIKAIPDFLFMNNPNLLVVDLHMNRIDELSHNSFAGLDKLVGLNLRGNNLTSLPFGIFDRFNGIKTLDIGENYVRQLSIEHFGNALRTLESLMADSNAITAMNHNVFDAATQLQTLFMSDNLCVDENFMGVATTRFAVRYRLLPCFKIYDEPDDDGSFVRCNFVSEDDHWACDLQIFNPNGRDDFRMIEGEFFGLFFLI
jgi:Leucine-rich repeat (LRR) protein